MKAKQYREASTEELTDKLDEFRKKLFELRTQAETETLANTKTMREIRHDISRIMTVIREREIKSATAAK
jgi:large subunit ribosomal protein L29